MKTQPINSLDNLMSGAVSERFNDELQKVLQNVLDPNTDPKKKRKLQFVVTVAPNEKRDAAEFSVDVKASLAPPVPVSTSVYIGKTNDGDVIAEEITKDMPGSINMFTGEIINPKTVNFGKIESEEK